MVYADTNMGISKVPLINEECIFGITLLPKSDKSFDPGS